MKAIKILNAACFISFLLVAGSACKKFEFSPYQTEQVKDMPGNLNCTNISKLKASEETADDTVCFIFSGDCQRFYEKFDDMIHKVNARTDVDFFILCGDIADFGLLQEYLWVHERLEKLKVPYLCAIGNHDLASNNGVPYMNVFGVKNYSFIYKGYKFIVHDTNSREYDFNGNVPNMWWLEYELKDTLAKWFVGVSHVPPYDVDFDKVLEQPYQQLLCSKGNFLLSLHGHLHKTTDSYHYNDHVRYMTCNAVDKDEFTIIKLFKGKILTETVSY